MHGADRIPLGHSPVPAYRRGMKRHSPRLYEAAYKLNVTKCPMRSMGVAGIAQSDSGPAMATSWVRDCAAVMRSRFSTCFSTVRGDRCYRAAISLLEMPVATSLDDSGVRRGWLLIVLCRVSAG